MKLKKFLSRIVNPLELRSTLAVVGWQVFAVSFSIFVAIAISGCSTFGANPTPPSKAESLLYTTVTNYVPVVVPSYVTNQQIVTQFQTNVQGVIVTQYQTNVIPVTVPAATNLQAQYTETLKPGVSGAVQSGGGILNAIFPGVGSIAANALLALLGGYGYLRSAKNGSTAAVLAQNVEVARQLLQALPNGTALDNAFVAFIQNHQAESGVIEQVINLVGSKVNNADAQVAAQQINQALQALNQATQPTTPKV